MSADLAAFLLARLAEDERESQVNPVRPYVGGWHRSGCDTYTYDPQECDCGLPARVLAEVAAKRQIIDEQTNAGGCQGHPRSWQPCADYRDYGDGYCRDYDGNSTLRWLALPYADHPDYREAWKP